jgi:hypothetical protein
MGKFSTTEDFIRKSKVIFGSTRFDYSEVHYIRNYISVKIICREHGIFEQLPLTHLRGSIGCKNCYLIKKVRSCTISRLESKFKGIVQPKEYKLIPLTEGLVTKVDNNVFKKVSKYTWHLSAGYVRNNKLGSLSRFILKCESDFEVDHKNRDKLDNRIRNLRLSNRCQNTQNMNGYIKTSIYKGVHKRKKSKKWTASIRSNNQRYHIGTFHDELEAAKAYDKKAKELHREFAVLNFP